MTGMIERSDYHRQRYDTKRQDREWRERRNARERARYAARQMRPEVAHVRAEKQRVRDLAALKRLLIVSAVETGMSYAEAAEAFGLSRSAVAGIVHRHKEVRA